MNATWDAGYEIWPGPADGTADKFGSGDLWALKYRENEMDDSDTYTGPPINIDPFLTGEPVFGEDLVVWYGAHHDHHPGDDTPAAVHLVGPTLRPIGL